MVSLSFPHDPEFEGVDLSTTLDRLVSRVEGHVIKFILLKEVGSCCTVAVMHYALLKMGKKRGITNRKKPSLYFISSGCEVKDSQKSKLNHCTSQELHGEKIRKEVSVLYLRG